MRRITLLLAAVLLFSAVCVPAHGASTSASAAILVDWESGRVLYEYSADEMRPIASITKLMTALVAAEEICSLDEQVEVRAEWLAVEGSSIYLRAGEQVSWKTLMYGLLLASGNDAARVIACACAGDEERFAERMNRKAEELGMENTHFTNASGLHDEEHYSTARDMAVLAAACLENECVAAICATKSITLEERTFVNHNRLLTLFEGCIGMKTGYTQRAGRTLVSAVERDGQTLIAVTLNDPNDWDDHMDLYEYGFCRWPLKELVGAGEAVGTIPVTGSLVRFVSVAAAEDFAYPMAAGEQMTVRVECCGCASAPVTAGEPAGRLVYSLNGEEVGSVELVYQNTVRRDLFPEQTLLQRILSAVLGETITVLAPVWAEMG